MLLDSHNGLLYLTARVLSQKDIYPGHLLVSSGRDNKEVSMEIIVAPFAAYVYTHKQYLNSICNSTVF